jgi:polyketide cyclase/dehydrase/lipid transport protein
VERRTRPAILAALAGALLSAGSVGPACGQATPATPSVTVQSRSIPNRDVKEVTAQGVVAAPPHVVRAVVADFEQYPAFMPYVKESRILSRDANGDVLNYQRLSFGLPLVRDRQYVIRIAERRFRERDGGRSYALVWRLEDWLPAGASPDAVRVSVNNGYWDLQPAKNSESATDVRYCVFTDPAGALPKWLVGLANSEGIPSIFAAVARAAASARYAALPPPPDTGEVAERLALDDCADAGALGR